MEEKSRFEGLCLHDLFQRTIQKITKHKITCSKLATEA